MYHKKLRNAYIEHTDGNERKVHREKSVNANIEHTDGNERKVCREHSVIRCPRYIYTPEDRILVLVI